MQVRDLIEKLQQFDPRDEVKINGDRMEFSDFKIADVLRENCIVYIVPE